MAYNSLLANVQNTPEYIQSFNQFGTPTLVKNPAWSPNLPGSTPTNDPTGLTADIQKYQTWMRTGIGNPVEMEALRNKLQAAGVPSNMFTHADAQGVMGFLNKAVPAITAGTAIAGIGAGLAGVAGVGPAAGGDFTGGGSGFSESMGGSGASSGAVASAPTDITITGGTAGAGSGLGGASGAVGTNTGVAATGLGGSAPAMGFGTNTGMVGAVGSGAGEAAGGSGMGSVMNSVVGSGTAPAAGAAAGILGTGLTAAQLLGTAGQVGLDLYSGQQRQNAADKSAQLADPFASQRGQYQTQLSNLMANPSLILQDPSYQFRLQQGQAALERSDSAKGYLNSGNILYDITNYGQQAASQELNNKIGVLSNLAGGNLSQGYAGNVYSTGTNNALAQQYQGLSQLGTLGTGLVNHLTNTSSS